MKMMKNDHRLLKLLIALVPLMFITACGEDEGDPPPQPVADFSFEVDVEDPLTYMFTNASLNAETYSWDFGDGNASDQESPVHTFGATGSYEVTLIASAGDLADSITKTVTIESPGGVPTGPNVINGWEMDDESAWTVTAGTDDGLVVDYEFTEDGTLYFSGEAQDEESLHQLHVWQAVELEADTEYLLYAEVSGGGFDFAYFEIDLGTIQPEDMAEYQEPNVDAVKGINPESSKVVGINNFLGCGSEAFEGDIIDIACDGPARADDETTEDVETNGRIEVSFTGTYYLLLKAGVYARTMGDGVHIDNMLLAPIVE